MSTRSEEGRLNQKRIGLVSWEGGDWYQLWLLDGANSRIVAEGHEITRHDWIDLLSECGVTVQQSHVDDDEGELCHCKEPGSVGLMI